MNDVTLNLSAWIERREKDVGTYADHIIHSVKAYEDEIAELRRKLGGGCDANNGGDHQAVKQGRYAFCGNCGESLTGVRYNHNPQPQQL